MFTAWSLYLLPVWLSIRRIFCIIGYRWRNEERFSMTRRVQAFDWFCMSEYELNAPLSLTGDVKDTSEKPFSNSSNTEWYILFVRSVSRASYSRRDFWIRPRTRHISFILSYSILSLSLSAVRFYRSKRMPFRNKGYTRDLEICHHCQCQTPGFLGLGLQMECDL